MLAIALPLATTLLASVAGVAQAQGPPGSERVYEQVSPADKGGYPVTWPEGAISFGVTAAAPDGQAVVFNSFGAFAGNSHGVVGPYKAVRTSSGWVTQPAAPAPTVEPDVAWDKGRIGWRSATPDLETALFITDNEWDERDTNFPVVAGTSYDGHDVYLRGPGGDTSLVSLGENGEATGHMVADASPFQVPFSDPVLAPDGETVGFTTDQHVVAADVGRPEGAWNIYTRSGGQTRLVNRLPGGMDEAACRFSYFPGQVVEPYLSTRHVISADGSRVLFQTTFPSFLGCDFPGLEHPELFVRLGDERTAHVSASRRDVPDSRVIFERFHMSYVDASADGSRIFFTSVRALTNDATDEGMAQHFYEFRPGATPESDSLELLNVEPGSVPVAVSQDGSRVFSLYEDQYTDEAVLSVVENGETREVVQFADLDPSVSSLVTIGDRLLSEDGTSLLFATTGSVAGLPSPGRQQLYLWRDGKGVVCVSCPSALAKATGDARIAMGNGFSGFGGPQFASSLAGDGSRVAFSSPDRIVAGDVNDQVDVYEWHEGRVSLVTSGRSAEESLLMGMSESGRDVFFLTGDGLVAGDVDGGDVDVYNARLGGGFPSGDGGGDGGSDCDGDGCQGPASPPAAVEVPDGQVGRGNVTAERRAGFALSGLSIAQRRTLARTGRLPMTVRVGRRGRVSLRMSARIAGRTQTVAATSRRVAGAGRVRLVLRLSSRARAVLARTGTLRLVLSASLDGRRAATRTLTLSRATRAKTTREAR